jgi:hypothetical protein
MWVQLTSYLEEAAACLETEITGVGIRGAGRSRVRVQMRSLIFLIYLILLATLGPEVYSAPNRNEYQKLKKISGEQSAAGA